MQVTGRITFNGVPLGDHGVLNVDYEGNVDVTIIPRAKGVRIRSTEDNGGGKLTITVNGAISRSTRVEVEDYFLTLETILDYTKAGTLIVNSESTVLELENCYLQTLTQDAGHNKLERFTAIFVKSI